MSQKQQPHNTNLQDKLVFPHVLPQASFSENRPNNQELDREDNYTYPSMNSQRINTSTFTYTGANMHDNHPQTRQIETHSERFMDYPVIHPTLHMPSFQTKIHCSVSIVAGRYDQVGNCWIDEVRIPHYCFIILKGQKKIEIQVEINVQPKSVTIYCRKESTNDRTKIVTIHSSKFELSDDGRWKYRHRCVPSFPVKSGVIHSPLRFIAEVIESNSNNNVQMLTFIGAFQTI